MQAWSLDEAIAYYKGQDAPQNQEALVALLREVQEEFGGVLPVGIVAELARQLEIKESLLAAIIKRYPSLRTDAAPNLLQICGGGVCGSKKAAALMQYVTKNYAVSNGGVSAKGRFSYSICGCLKQCGQGPNVKWNGRVYNNMDVEKLEKLIKGK